ncbi:MAG TPA: polyprenol phosphomannose-dependent alpha 1,6 mannosyltransferase MptB, partial [Jatrophihabitantaceae bacterium]
MNDLAEKALHGLDGARRAIASRPVVSLAVAGCVVACALVVSGARIGAAPSAVPLNRWLGLVPSAQYQVTDVWLGVFMLAMIGALLALWLGSIHVVRQRHCRDRAVWIIAAAWAAPFALGPPLLSTDIYRHVAAGLLARRGLSPYHHGPDSLGGARLVDAIDPTWRSTPSTDGPLATLLSHLAVSISGGSVLTSVIVLRVIAVASAIVIGMLAADLAGPRRALALSLTVLNPAVLLYVISAGLFTGVLVALLLAAIVSAAQRRWVRAVIFA